MCSLVANDTCVLNELERFSLYIWQIMAFVKEKGSALEDSAQAFTIAMERTMQNTRYINRVRQDISQWLAKA